MLSVIVVDYVLVACRATKKIVFAKDLPHACPCSAELGARSPPARAEVNVSNQPMHHIQEVALGPVVR
jgi:hypothetical protein